MAPNQRAMKKWEIFPGRNKFYCDGFLMTAPNSSVFYLTVVLITGTSALFFIFDCPFLAEKISISIPILGGFLYLFTMCSLLRTTFSDPGILVRASQDEAAYIEKQIEVPNSLNSPTYRPPPRTKEVVVNGQTVKLKYCFTCKIFRPPRASHCSLCDNCVDRFDHHCPWVANCVGKRNYRFFYMFIVSLAFLAVFIFACALTHLVLLQTEKRDFLDVIRMSPFSLVVSIICFLSIWSVIGLAGFHTYLTTSNQTTNEDIKGSFSNKGGGGNPYSRGNICLNCFYILCGPQPPSLIDRRGIVTEEYRSQMQHEKSNIQAPPIIVQQLSSKNDAIKVYNQNETESKMHGIYRQRSCDNLQNEKCSTTVSHLVENELPIASVNIQLTASLENSVRTSRNKSTDLQDLNEIEVISENESSINNNNNNTSSDTAAEQYAYFRDKINSLNIEVDSKIEETPQYSNVPSISPSSNVPIILKNAASDHVYSNIDETVSQSNNAGGNRLMSDSIELDLDDPLLTSSFIKKNDAQNVYEASIGADGQTSSKMNIPSISSSSSTGTQITSIELKKVLNVVAFQRTNHNQTTKQPVLIAPTLRQETMIDTMIDTALDLDSLDGSQVGLMK